MNAAISLQILLGNDKSYITRAHTYTVLESYGRVSVPRTKAILLTWDSGRRLNSRSPTQCINSFASVNDETVLSVSKVHPPLVSGK